jgi:hypothetical protein
MHTQQPLTVKGVEDLIKAWSRDNKLPRGGWKQVWENTLAEHVRENVSGLTLERATDARPAHKRGSEFGAITSPGTAEWKDIDMSGNGQKPDFLEFQTPIGRVVFRKHCGAAAGHGRQPAQAKVRPGNGRADHALQGYAYVAEGGTGYYAYPAPYSSGAGA